jgi:dihydrofolate reductase
MIIGMFAVDDNSGVGNNGGMPWPPNKEDFKWFRETTLNHIVVMGKTTWNSPDMPKPLPKRTNVVIANNCTEIKHADVVFSGNVPDALKLLTLQYLDKDVFVIGGVNILLQAKPVLEKLYITRIPGIYDADTQINLENFLEGFILTNTRDLGSCKVEEYEAIQRST